MIAPIGSLAFLAIGTVIGLAFEWLKFVNGLDASNRDDDKVAWLRDVIARMEPRR